MYKFAICDDDAAALSATRAVLTGYLARRPALSVRHTAFHTGAALLDAVADGETFDLYILDVLMPGLNGIAVGKALRDLSAQGEIVYLTASPDFAVASYQTEALSYLLKPVEPEAFCQVCDKAVALFQRRRAEGVTVATKDGLRRLPFDEILYAERAGRIARYFLLGGATVDSRALRGSFAGAIAPLLTDRRFFRCGASFVLNLHQIQGVDADAALFPGGLRVPLSRALQRETKQAWLNYWLDEP